MNDLLPEQTAHWQEVEDLFRHHFSRAGIGEIRTPLMETTDLFFRGIGELTDVVGKEMYTFFDRGNRSCTLRPEGTAAVVRSVLQNGLLSQGPKRFWYGGPMFRYERPQAGRLRQFHQIGVEFFGLPTARDDAELIALAWDIFSALKLKDLNLELNTLGTSEDRERYRSELIKWLEKKYDFLDKDSQERVYKNPLRILDSKDSKTQQLLNDAPCLYDSLSESSKNRFLDLQKILNTLEIPFQINKRLVRGLDYYCQTAFEITTDQLGSQKTICGGGRYDGLVQELGGSSTPSVGWAVGMERLMILLNEQNLYQKKDSPDVYFINQGISAEPEALSLTRKLRTAGLNVELDSSASSFSKQFKKANKSNAKWALIIGEEEFSAGEVRIKKLKFDGEDFKERNISKIEISKLISILKSY